jgi:3-keto-5-aminohexanoate cleavage enzyme
VNFGDEVFENSFPIMRGILAEMRRYEVTPELELFDRGHLANAVRLQREGLLAFPQHCDIVLGVPGGLDATVENLVDFVRALPAGCTWSVAGIGRVGLEDNLYYEKGRLARNEELVARVARIAAELGRPTATPAQAREILRLPTPVEA